ncbi:restriction endonuclease subunit S [Streptomyces sp. NPDC001833]|uniref:restriction endonuclease subunit S n=1 Tax=Streptomyces sp. NPDC001833 TaxID=3154658 RepID=UPI00332066F5
MREAEVVELGDVALPQPGSFVDGPFGSNLKSEEYIERAEVRLIQLQNIGLGDWINKEARYITHQKADSLRRHEALPGDLAIAKMADPIARACILPSRHERYVVVADCIKLRVDESRFDRRFIVAVLNSWNFRRSVESISTGTTRLRVGLEALKRVRIWAPSLREQSRIADTLDAIREKASAHKGIIRKLRLVEQSIIADSMKSTNESHRERLEHLTSLIVDGVHHTPKYVSNGVPFVTVENLTRGGGISFHPIRYVSTEDHLEYSRRASPTVGDILVSKDGTLGVSRVVPDGSPEFSIFVSVALIRPRPALLNSHYGAMFFDSPDFFRQLGNLSSGTGLKHIHLSDFRQFVLNVPPVSEQEALVARVEATRNVIRMEESALARLNKLEQGLMDDLLTGRVRVPIDVQV